MILLCFMFRFPEIFVVEAVEGGPKVVSHPVLSKCRYFHEKYLNSVVTTLICTFTISFGFIELN